MAPRKVDPFKPAVDAQFSKGQVNRAGQLLREFFRRDLALGEGVFEGWDVDQLVDAMVAVTWWRSLHAAPLSKVAANLRYHVEAESGKVSGRIDVAQRLKKRPTIIDKLDRLPQMDVTDMEDIGGVRARLPSLAHVAAISRRLKKTWTIKRTRDYIAEQKPSGYRAIHHIVRRDGRLIEVQLRTVRQDAWANQVEDDGRQLAVGFKFGFGDADIHDYYVAMGEAFAAMDRGELLSDELVRHLSARYMQVRGRLKRKARQ